MKLFTRYLNSAAFFDTPDAPGKTPAEIEREKIKATVSVTKAEDQQEQEQEEENKEEEKDDDKEEDDENDDEKDGEKDPPANETDEQKQERIAAEKQARKDARIQKRIDKLVADANLTKQENERLKKQLEANPDNKLTEEEVQARAEKLAADMVKQRTSQEIQKQFEADCKVVQDAAMKSDKDFMTNINAAAEDVGPIPAIMIGILKDLDNENGGEVLAYLAKNVDDYEEVHGLSEGRMTAKLIRLSDKIKAEAEAAKAAKKKQRSNVPDPITPVNEGRDARSSTVLPSNPTKSREDMENFVRIRNEQTAARRKANGGLL